VTAFAEVAFNVVPAVSYLVMAVVAMARMEWRLAVVVLSFTPVPALLGAWASREQTQRERKLLGQWTTLYSRFNEVLAGIRTVKIFAMEEVERRRFLSGQRAGTDVVRVGVRRDTVTNALRDFAATLSRLVAIAGGGLLVARGEITLGTLVAVLGYIGGLFGPVQGLTNIYQTLRKGTVSLESIFQILDTPDPVEDLPEAVEVQQVRGEVVFENVSFSYENGPAVLSDVSLRVSPGETVAIVGASGSGKTTLMALLQRLYPLAGGRILVDGVDIRTMTQQSLRRHLGVVNQYVNLFNDTVRDNIAYARPTADDEEVEAAARAAQAHDFILALPEGYDTVVGEHGSRLSGGQRQRIGIARALLKDAPILILDEATSALDAASEAAIQDALRTLTEGRTTFVIAHRLSTVVSADRIVVMKDGAIVAVGTHAELMAAGGYYASLVRRQAAGLALVQAA
jgi:ATP-binding cassette subfamily B protein